MVKRGRYFWKMIESPAPNTDLDMDSLGGLGENPSAWRQCGEINGETRLNVDVWTTYVLDLDISSHTNLLRCNDNVIIIKRPRQTHCSKYVYKRWVLAQKFHWSYFSFAFESWSAISTSEGMQGQQSCDVFLGIVISKLAGWCLSTSLLSISKRM